jgi:TIR domain/WD domain, G-beta repeat
VQKGLEVGTTRTFAWPARPVLVGCEPNLPQSGDVGDAGAVAAASSVLLEPLALCACSGTDSVVAVTAVGRVCGWLANRSPADLVGVCAAVGAGVVALAGWLGGSRAGELATGASLGGVAAGALAIAAWTLSRLVVGHAARGTRNYRDGLFNNPWVADQGRVRGQSRVLPNGRQVPDSKSTGDPAVVSGRVFLSYVREDAAVVDRLQQALEDAGIPVWRDTVDIGLGLDWRMEIRRAITDEALVFVACFSDASVTRERTEQREELTLAAEEYRRRRPDRPWLIPVRLSECRLPAFDLGAGKTLMSLNWLDLFGDRWESGCARLIREVRHLLPSDDLPAGRHPGRRWSRRAVVTTAIMALLGGALWRLLHLGADGEEIDLGSEDGELATLSGHDGYVLSVAFSSDGALLASSSGDKTVKLWNPTNHQEIATLNGHDIWVRSVAFSSDGTLLASAGGADQTVRLWNPRSAEPITTLRGHDEEVWSVAFSPDGTVLASGSTDGTVRLWELETYRKISTLSGAGLVRSVAFSPDGELLATGSEDNMVRLWEPRPT